jgi:hypothetical protein
MRSVSVGCSKQGYIELDSAPVGSIMATIWVAGAAHPADPPFVMFSAANKLLVAVGADVPEIMNWCAGKLGPWFV